jgi:hypothetical protein
MFEDFARLGPDRTPQLYAPPQPSPLPFLVVMACAAFVCWFVLMAIARRAVRFWWLERLTFWLVLCAASVLAWALMMRFFGGRAASRFGRNEDVFQNVGFLAMTALCWGWLCRPILLFNLARYQRFAAAMPSTTCFACGYDLRGSSHSAVCPECGTKVVAAQKELKD